MAPMNGTQTAKNCTDPGKKSVSPLASRHLASRWCLCGRYSQSGDRCFDEPGWERVAVRHRKGDVQALISCAAKQLWYFLYPATGKVTLESFKISFFFFFVLTTLLKAVLILFARGWAGESLFSFPFAHGIHLMELSGQQMQLPWQVALWDDPPVRVTACQGICRGRTLWRLGSLCAVEVPRVWCQLGKWILLAAIPMFPFRLLQGLRGCRDPEMTFYLFCHRQVLLKQGKKNPGSVPASSEANRSRPGLGAVPGLSSGSNTWGSIVGRTQWGEVFKSPLRT